MPVVPAVIVTTHIQPHKQTRKNTQTGGLGTKPEVSEGTNCGFPRLNDGRPTSGAQTLGSISPFVYADDVVVVVDVVVIANLTPFSDHYQSPMDM